MSGDRKSLVRHTQCVVTVCNFFTVWTCPVSHPATLPSTKRPKPPIGFLFVPFKPSSPSPSSTSPMSSYSNIRDCKSFLKPEKQKGKRTYSKVTLNVVAFQGYFSTLKARYEGEKWSCFRGGLIKMKKSNNWLEQLGPAQYSSWLP